MLSLAVVGLIGAALLLAFKSASAQSTGSDRFRSTAWQKTAEPLSHSLLRGESDHENQAYPHARL
jgi:hypothetical protein